ncbi:MAG: type II secretion system GspH family protein [Candidatus Gastranaerophilales bacterium]|nr:type II secretion system GspH family protein [Candidatus Gastranaerophilales bacterium]
MTRNINLLPVILIHCTFNSIKSRIKAKMPAFTLAEVLITLAIIGVIAAMTIPAVLNHTKETQLKTGLKKAQSILSEALQLMIYDTGVIPTAQNYTDATFLPTFATYISQLRDCGYHSCVTFNSEESTELLENCATKTYRNYNNTNYANGCVFNEGQTILADGMLLMVQINSSREELFLSFDVNGIGNKPNKLGHDLFTFQVMADTGELKPMGASNTAYPSRSYCSKTSSSSVNGVGCTYKALTEKDYFKNLP